MASAERRPLMVCMAGPMPQAAHCSQASVRPYKLQDTDHLITAYCWQAARSQQACSTAQHSHRLSKVQKPHSCACQLPCTSAQRPLGCQSSKGRCQGPIQLSQASTEAADRASSFERGGSLTATPAARNRPQRCLPDKLCALSLPLTGLEKLSCCCRACQDPAH